MILFVTCRQGIAPAVTSELFGLQHFATNYAIIQMGPALGGSFCTLHVSLSATLLVHHCARHAICARKSGAQNSCVPAGRR